MDKDVLHWDVWIHYSLWWYDCYSIIDKCWILTSEGDATLFFGRFVLSYDSSFSLSAFCEHFILAFKMSPIIRLLDVMIPYFYAWADSPPLFFSPSFSPSLPPSTCLPASLSPIFLSLPAPSQSQALILISDEMIALLFPFFFSSPPSPQQLS